MKTAETRIVSDIHLGPNYSRAANGFHKILQYIEQEISSNSKYLLMSSISWFNLSYKITIIAVGYAKEPGINKTFCGHTREPMSLISENVNYCNTGCWTPKTSSLISICDKGVTLHEKH